MQERISPARRIAGALRLPGDKSISHRYAMLSAIAEGTTRIRNRVPFPTVPSASFAAGLLACPLWLKA